MLDSLTKPPTSKSYYFSIEDIGLNLWYILEEGTCCKLFSVHLITKNVGLASTCRWWAWSISLFWVASILISYHYIFLMINLRWPIIKYLSNDTWLCAKSHACIMQGTLSLILFPFSPTITQCTPARASAQKCLPCHLNCANIFGKFEIWHSGVVSVC